MMKTTQGMVRRTGGRDTLRLDTNADNAQLETDGKDVFVTFADTADTGRDFIDGGDGSDRIRGGGGNDLLMGGLGDVMAALSVRLWVFKCGAANDARYENERQVA